MTSKASSDLVTDTNYYHWTEISVKQYQYYRVAQNEIIGKINSLIGALQNVVMAKRQLLDTDKTLLLLQLKLWPSNSLNYLIQKIY